MDGVDINCILRITGGSWKGRNLKQLKGFKGRPTTDFGREGLFNLLRTRIDLEGSDVLDLFAGTGMVGIECASRGASSVSVVEKNNSACRYIKNQYELLNFENVVVVCADAVGYLQRASTQFDLVFADPPYEFDQLTKIPSLVRESGLLAKDGLFVLEHGERVSFDGEKGFVERRKYGHVHFSFFIFDL